MFIWISLKTISLITISFSVIFITHSYCDNSTDDQLKQECDTWNNFCKSARSNTDNRFRCLNEVVYFYEPEPRGWDEARQICSSKFNGSYFADLVQVPNNKKLIIKDMLAKLNVDKNTEIATSGVCCMKKQANNQFATECGWLSTLGSDKSSDLFNGSNPDKCNILTIRYDGSQLIGSTALEKSSDPHLPYLCGFNLPDKCVPENYNPTTRSPCCIFENSNSKQTINTNKIDDSLGKISHIIDQGFDYSNSTKLLEMSNKLNNILKNNEIMAKNSMIIIMKIVNKMQEQSKILYEYQANKFTQNIVESLSRVIVLMLNRPVIE